MPLTRRLPQCSAVRRIQIADQNFNLKLKLKLKLINFDQV